ncbi:U-box domain-containing protein kinase family protein isoform 1 [Tripterygium wilfordii]|uniref:RING-type E3 ubiquitin transferase n=1 Tax=Tripterygium wilfordii TaxID=458696 RepID=A0A7J7BZS7_TRIWF|nr:U-box domain-containing protein kinase family protein isoform 1 [Tripterygium wilfordii]
MEVLEPVNPTRSLSSPPALMVGFGPPASSSSLPEIAEEGSSGSDEKVYVAVGKSVEKGTTLLRWAFRRFEGTEICILHVHQPSPFIPTLLGKLPASQANGEVVSAHRREEKAQMTRLLDNYLSICRRTQVTASAICTEADQVQKEIVELVSRHRIRKLVMGAVPEKCMKVKKSSGKARYAAKSAPPFCEIWFVNKDKLLWTREAFEGPSSLQPCSHAVSASAEFLRSKSLRCGKDKLSFNPDFLCSKSTRISHGVQGEPVHTEMTLSLDASTSTNIDFPFQLRDSSSSASTNSSEYTYAERSTSSDYDSKVEEESLCILLTEARLEAESFINEAVEELLKWRRLETEAMDAISKVKVFESSHACEVTLRKQAEDALRATIQEQEKVLEEKEKVARELQRTMRNVVLLDSRAQEANRRRDEASGELKLIQASVAALLQEKQRIRRQKMEAVRWLERWRSRGQVGAANYNGVIGLVEDLPALAKISLSDLQTATCNFSESFKLSQGGYGCVYKGEMLGRTVAIRKLHPYNMQGHLEFEKEVQVLSKLQHPHLVTLLGVCPEAWCLVYEYLPNGSLQDQIFRKCNNAPMSWKMRTRILAEISSALCFLHSYKPERIVHGDLKPENILLNSELSSKICEFGICRLIAEETLHCPSFRQSTEPKGAFAYMDPEFHRIGVLTPKSDVYSFGVIILQLLTGKPPVGLVGEARRAMSSGKLSTILDPSAGEWPSFVARRLVDYGVQCCESNSRDRPELTPTLVRELEQLHVSEERPVPSFFLCPILRVCYLSPAYVIFRKIFSFCRTGCWISLSRWRNFNQ